jgi:hypothetical protein
MSFKGLLWRIDKLGMDLFQFHIHERLLIKIKWDESARESWERATQMDIGSINLAVANGY